MSTDNTTAPSPRTERHNNLLNRPLRVVTYTDAAGIGGAEISLSHLVATVADNIDVTILGTSQHVVNAIAALRPQAARLVLPATGLDAVIAHFTALRRLRPDVVHLNLCTPWVCATGLFAALTLPNVRVVRVDQLPLRTTDAIALWRTRMLSLRVDAHVAVGEASARRMEDFYALGRGTVISIPNCVPDVGEPKPPPVRPDAHNASSLNGMRDYVQNYSPRNFGNPRTELAPSKPCFRANIY